MVKLKSLTPEQAKSGVIAMSAGNHAQGVAYHAQKLGIPATIVMPDFAPFAKVERTKGFGARVVLHGDTLDASAQVARKMAAEENLTFVHPYDDDLVIAGQGTAGLEIMEDHPDLDILVVPIGGGGLISGIAIAAKTIKPDLEIIGVQASLFPSMYQALNGITATAGGNTIADGIAVKVPGERTKIIIKELVSEILLVDESAIEYAVHSLVERQKLVAEGAGAAGVAAILNDPARFAGKKVGTVICGGNIDIRLLSAILTRGLVRDGRIARIRVGIVDQPGVLAKITNFVGQSGANIIEVHHQRLFYDVPPKQAEIDLVMETRNMEHVEEIIAKLSGSGFPTRLLSSRSTQSQD